MDKETELILTQDNEKLVVSEKTLDYHRSLKREVKRILEVAEQAKQKGYDPKKYVEIYIAQDVASRTEGLVGPPGIAKRLREMEDIEKIPKDKIVILIAKEIASGKFNENASLEDLADQALRTALSFQTEGITAAPIEGIGKVTIKSNPNGSQYLAVYYAGPIRSAGGTAQGVSIYIADEIRKELKLAKYTATDDEVERMLEETRLYNNIMHLQLPTSDEEIRHAWRNIPIMVTGDPTEEEEVSGYRNIDSMDTNRVRGGACLVLNDGLVGRAKKIIKRTKKLELEGWEWLEEIASGKYTDQRATENSDDDKPMKVQPDYSFASDALMGRPTFSDATARGGFRLRYGHARNTGIAGIGVHPAIMGAVDDFMATGTHVRTERPGKGSIVTPISSVKPPVVLLKNGDVVELNNYQEAKKVVRSIKKILFMGDMLVGVGEFLQNNYRLVPPGYNEEWWALEMLEAGWKGKKDGEHDIKFFERMSSSPPSIAKALELSLKFKVALHPKYTPAWIYLTQEEVKNLWEILWQSKSSILDKSVKIILEKAFIVHQNKEEGLDLEEFIMILKAQLPEDAVFPSNTENGLECVQKVSPLLIKDLIGTTVGARMGRPEKAKARLMKPKLHGLFPVGDGRKINKQLSRAMEQRVVNVRLSNRRCEQCNLAQYNLYCEKCGEETRILGRCINKRCGRPNEVGPCDFCGGRVGYTKYYEISMTDYVKNTRRRIGSFPKLVKLKDQINNPSGIPELLDKGILRAEYDLNVFRDGTIRYDATDAPLTHFYPREIMTSIERLQELGYTHDMHDIPLTTEDQLLELKVQDIIIHESSIEHLVHVSKFIDNELEKIYSMDKFYKIKSAEGLLGQLVIGLAPHTSAGVIGRIVGFTKSSVCWAHPFWHTSKRRNCVSGDEEILLWDMRNNKFMKRTIGEIVEKVKSTKQGMIVDDYGTYEFKNPYPHIYAFSMDETTNETILSPIKNWIKGSTEEWINITTATGKTLRMTPDHNQLVWNGNELKRKSAKKLNIGDQIPVIHHLPEIYFENKDHITRINILKEFSDKLPRNEKFNEFRNDLRLRDAREWMENKLTVFAQSIHEKSIQSNSDNLIVINKLGPKQSTKILKKYFSNKFPIGTITQYFNMRWYTTIPLSHLEVLQEEGVFDWLDIPEETSIGIARNDASTSPYLDINEDLMQLLGLFISEGHIRDEYGCYQVNLSIQHEELHDYAFDLIKRVFRSEPYTYKDSHAINHVNKVHAYLFAYAWKMNKTALTKRLPEYVFQLPRILKISLLSAIIDGDGTVTDSHKVITIYTGNKKLAQDYSLLVNSLGVFARIHHNPKSRYGKKILQRYAALGKEPKIGKGMYSVTINGLELYRIVSELKFIHPNKEKKRRKILKLNKPNSQYLKYLTEETILDKIKDIEVISQKSDTYCLTIDSENSNFSTNLVRTSNCDGDEDGVILLMDGFLNFSKEYLPTTRGSKMDTPLVLVVTLNPHEVDDEAFNLDSMTNYGLDFYKAAEKMAKPSTIVNSLHRAENRLGTEGQYEGFVYSHATNDISEGPLMTRYKDSKLSIRDKLNEQLSLAKIISAVDDQQTALRILEKHALPDLQGNLRAFASQTVRCVNCNTKYRRVPLNGKCKNEKCQNSKIILTVPPKGVSKYFDICEMLIKKFNLGIYHENRLERIKISLESLFPEEILEVVDLSEWF